MSGGPVRCLHEAAAVPGAAAPYDTVHLRVFHPTAPTGDERERQTGEFPADPAEAPWPVVVVLPGVNIGPEGYRWLAERWVGVGCCVVTLALVGEIMPGAAGITPGMDLEACRPDTYGTRPSCTTLGPVLGALERLGRAGRLAGLLDLDRVVLAGHSAGGTMALQNASTDWFPVAAVLSYASHTMASTMFGWPPGSVLPVPSALPTLVMGGEFDGVMAASAVRYGTDGHVEDPVVRTFDEGVPHRDGPEPTAHLAILRGATHTSVIHPADHTTARGFLDPEPGRPDAAVRHTVAELTSAFLAGHVLDRPHERARLRQLLADGSSVVHGRSR